MRNRMNQLKTGGLLLAAAMIFLFAAGAVQVNPLQKGELDKGADLIIIDTMQAMGPLERPPVPFFHSRHTEALEKTGRDCTACHMGDEKGRLSPKFKRLDDADRQTVTDLYHLNCIGCHRELSQSNQKSGPQTCGGCHQQEPKVASTWSQIPFDRSLHFRHVKTTEEKCESCHHEFDKKTNKLIYTKGNEGACMYCHKETAVENAMASREAFHYQCIGCHREKAAKNQKAGPVDCLSCHDADHREGIEVVTDVPRLQRNQPDAVLVKTGFEALPAKERPTTMKRVPFDHRAHEGYNQSCKVCHHADLTSCSTCHTMEGKKEGGSVSLAQAMHSVTDPSSCIGCHRTKQMEPQCAGCHAPLGKKTQTSDQSCNTCHMAPLPSDLDLTHPEKTQQVAAGLLKKRNAETQTYAERQIPEKVMIGTLSDRFEPADFPHGKVVKALIEKAEGSKLAGVFHTEKGTLCQGCHHNSPATDKPPVCSSCHTHTIENSDAFRPGLLGAYHQQCIGCHEVMGIEKPAARDCNACHVEKNKK